MWIGDCCSSGYYNSQKNWLVLCKYTISCAWEKNECKWSGFKHEVGALVPQVISNDSAAAEAGIQAGEIILSTAKARISSRAIAMLNEFFSG
jgi:hypothetical protein